MMRHANRPKAGQGTRILSRLLLVVVVVALVTAGGVVVVDQLRGQRGAGVSSGEAEDGGAGGTGRVRLNALPAVAQHGDRPANADKARMVLTARIRPAARGDVVLLQRRRGEEWRTVDSTQQDKSGQATFDEVKAPRKGGSPHFRAVALAPDGTVDATSSEVDGGRWTLVFGDQFRGASLDASKWAYRQLGSYNENGSRACSMSDERAVSVSGGTLRLQVMEDPARIGEPCYTEEYGTLSYYLNGHVATEQIYDFKYGVAAARVKFPQGRGQHGAFWMQPSDPESVPGNPKRSGAEIDIVEFFGEGYPGGGLASFLYYLNADEENEKVGGVWPQATKDLPPGDAWWRSYHVFSVEWTPRSYVFRVDGREIFRSKEGVSGIEQYLILSLLSSDWELPKLDQDTLPSTMEVDWVRVWQKKPPTG